ncbi:MAG: hypothetical protein COS14_05915 [Bacteroidetes bacterium CG02_land_8_20_14_3_00_31_25]|nr:hypothetical protein [Bacteroidota bacterium]PIV59420.1 MAG: hypothetical protein COS14_05915 [Bacteroidetes bacterium CG02_land_8_20_14_3_00_31_25]PIX36495.1 MAG: hypothetical protein COZ59_00780 [Bacteroidetes bacterium CG_4_8_14_3_um_filter_31_14]PIY06045.1 MAG: hypothetical protein COZ21_03380 [Bacteroidetes bacterium CG_4_10_14_3_um_filter_31_20]
MLNKEININQFSPHIFWDVDRQKIDFIKNKKWLIQRVLEYGLLNDWQIIYKYYGIEEIAQISINLKELDNKSVSFISVLANIPKEKFLCYTIKQSNPKHWNF